MVRSQASGWALPGSEWSLEFKRSPAQTESAGVSVCSVQKSTSSKRWLYVSAVAVRCHAQTHCCDAIGNLT